MIRIFLISELILSASVAHAQTLQQQTPTQIAIKMDNIINTWAETIEAQQKVIAELQKQVADLKAKYEPPSK